MSKTPIFKKERNIYWPAEFSPVADLLIGKSENGETNPNRFFQMYVQVLVLAACIGVSNKRKREVGSGPKKEVSTQIFYSNKLDEYLLLIPMLANPDQGQEILKPENDDFLIRFDNFMQDIGQRPKVGELVGTIPYELPKYSREELIKIVSELKTNAGFTLKNNEPTAAVENQQQEGFFQRLKSLFKK
jgi:hypothetical protein